MIIRNRNSTSSTVCNGPQKILHQDRNENRLLLSIVPARFNKICCPCVWTGSQPKAFFNWVQKKRCDYTPDYGIQVVEFRNGGYKIRKKKFIKINIFKGNYWILRIGLMGSLSSLQKSEFLKLIILIFHDKI